MAGDPGRQLLDLINARVAKGENRLYVQSEVLREHPGLVRQWHRGEAPEPPEPEEALERKQHDLDEVDPGVVLQQLTAARVRLGMSRERARAMTSPSTRIWPKPITSACWSRRRSCGRCCRRPASVSCGRARIR